MASEKVDRRGFFRRATALTATAAAFSFEERALLAYQQRGGEPPEIPGRPSRDPQYGPTPLPTNDAPMPMGKIGDLKISRLIAGHNLVGAQAHSRDLIYTSQLLRAYFTDDRILDTYQKYEESGINTAFLRVETRQLAIAKKYKADRKGKLQWMAQLVINERDQTHDLDLAMQLGAQSAYVRGLEGDSFFKAGKLDLIARTIEKVKSYKIPCGLASHEIDTLMAAEKLNVGADFYVKTFNSAKYWSAGPPAKQDPNWKPTATQLVQPEYGPATHDNIWETTPRQTAEWFKTIKKPWVAYKVVAAGAIPPTDGFKYAFAQGADFISVGMYDFQVSDDVTIVKDLLAGEQKDLGRQRPWCA